ncbi:MAG: biopolymer transporter ExbD [Spirochaetales bacterium]|nr:biopolymer transporter ExbD [Spirochaetales bacterium]
MRFSRRLKPEVNINLVPMIDVVFQLVIFFMVSTTFIVNPGISVVLPGSTTSEPVAMTKLVVSIVSRNEIYFNSVRYDLEGIDQALSEITEPEKNQIKTVIIEGDRAISYELMVNVLDILRKHGFKGVNLRTRQVD